MANRIRVSLVSKETGHVFRVPVFSRQQSLNERTSPMRVEEVSFEISQQVFELLDEWVFRVVHPSDAIEWIQTGPKLERQLDRAIAHFQFNVVNEFGRSPITFCHALAAIQIMKVYASKTDCAWRFEPEE